MWHARTCRGRWRCAWVNLGGAFTGERRARCGEVLGRSIVSLFEE